MRIREFGSGSPVVLFHGAPTTPAHLDPLALRLAEAHRVLIPDLPGYGATPPLVPYALERLDALVEEALRTAGVSALVAVGFSSGVRHALALATRGHLEVRGIVALAGGGDLSEADREAAAKLAAALRSGLDLRPLAPDVMLSPDVARRTPQAIAEVEAWATATSPENLANELLAHAAAPSLLEAARALDIPVVVRIGERDQAVPLARCVRLVDACRHAVLEKVPGVGHALLLEDFEGTLRSVERLIERSAPAAVDRAR